MRKILHKQNKTTVYQKQFQKSLNKYSCFPEEVSILIVKHLGINPQTEEIIAHPNPIMCCALSHCNTKIFTGSTLHDLKIWDTETGLFLKNIVQCHKSCICDIAIFQDDSKFITGGRDGTCKIWDLQTLECLHIFTLPNERKCYKSAAFCVKISHNEQFLVVGSDDKAIILWDLNSKEMISCVEGQGDEEVHCLCISNCDSFIIYGTVQKKLKYWRKNSKQILKEFKGHDDRIWFCVLTANDKKLISGSADEKILIFDVETTEILNTIYVGEPVYCCTLVPDLVTNYFINGSYDGIIRIFDVDTGYCKQTDLAHENAVLTVSVSEDGRFILSGDMDGNLKFSKIYSHQSNMIPSPKKARCNDGRGSFDLQT